MKAAALRQTLCGVILTFVLISAFTRAEAQQLNPATTFSTVANRMLERRAVDAAIWGMPMVSLDTLRQAYFRDGKPKYGDIVWWPKGSTWKNQSPTPNTSLRYSMCSSNTNDDGPIVLDLPPAANGSSFLESVRDHAVF
jgi:hypothetical protein